MHDFSEGIARRNRVNLSDDAYNILSGDCFSFARSEVIKYSEMISRVFLSFVEESAAKRQDMARVSELLAKKPARAQQKAPSLRNGVIKYFEHLDIISLLGDAIYGGSQGKCNSLASCYHPACDALKGCDGAGKYGSPGKFIKAVLEEYAELTYIERERIYFRDTADKITANLHSRLRITSGPLSFIVKPYSIMSDKLTTYNYLVGYSALSSTPDDYRIASFRLSRIESVAVVPDSPFSFNDMETDRLSEAITEKGVAYLIDEMCDLAVELTDAGKALFKTILFQRPEVIEMKGDVYRFRCTKLQAEAYFFRFGGEARIIEPESLREMFAKRYAKANDVYSAYPPAGCRG